MQRTRAYNVWSEQEKQALQNGVLKHGLGAWEVIRKDPEFACLEKRSGVQLKDKFRNLIKFRHLSEDQSRQLKPKANGPWSRKYTSSGNQQLDRAHTRSPSRLTSPIPTPENEHAEALLALENRGRSGNGEDTQSEGEGGQSSKQARKRRRSLENRNFGIYDTRRYKADGTQWVEGDGMQGTFTHEELMQRGRGRGRARGKRRASARARSRYTDYDDEDSEMTEEDEEELEALRNGDRRRSQRSGRRRQTGGVSMAASPTTNSNTGSHASAVACPCGAQEDDGTLMIECEDCKCWAHQECLQNAMKEQPQLHHYNLEQYRCLNCQHRSVCALLGGTPGGGINGAIPLAQGIPLSFSPFGMPGSHGHLGGMHGMHGCLPAGIAGGPPFTGGFGAFVGCVPMQHQSQQGGGSTCGLEAAIAAQQQELLCYAGLGATTVGGEDDGSSSSSSSALAVLAAQQQELLRCTGLLGPTPTLPSIQPQHLSSSAPHQHQRGGVVGGEAGRVLTEGGVDADVAAEAAVPASIDGKQAGCVGGLATVNGIGGSGGSSGGVGSHHPGGVSPSNEAIVQLLALTSKDGLKDSVLDEDAANGLARPGSTRPLLRTNSAGVAKRGGSGSGGSLDEWGAALQGLQSHSVGMAGLIRSGSSMGLGNGNPVASDDYADPLANFLAITRAGSALGHRSNSPARPSAAISTSAGALADPIPISGIPSPMSAAAAAVNASAAATAAAQRARAERATSGSMGGIGGSSSNLCADGVAGYGGVRSTDGRPCSRGAIGPGSSFKFDGARDTSHQSLDRLLAVAHAAECGAEPLGGPPTSEAAVEAATASASLSADPAAAVAIKLEQEEHTHSAGHHAVMPAASGQLGARGPVARGCPLSGGSETPAAASGPGVLHYPVAQHAGSGGFRPPSRGPLLPPSLPTPAPPTAAQPIANGSSTARFTPASGSSGVGFAPVVNGSVGVVSGDPTGDAPQGVGTAAAAAAAADGHAQTHQHHQLLHAQQPHLQNCPPHLLLGFLGAGPVGNAHSAGGMPLFPHAHHHHPAYPNRAPTPSSAFIDSLLRGATPDIAIAPLMHGAAVAGNGGAAGAQLSQLSSIHQELAQLTHGGHPGLGGPLDALRPGTPDAWALWHGATTPTPDFHILQATLANDFGANWLFNRGTPPLPPVADMQVPQPVQQMEQQPQLQQPGHTVEQQPQLQQQQQQQPPKQHPGHTVEQQRQLQQQPHPVHTLEQQPWQSHPGHTLEQQQLWQQPQSHPGHTLEQQPAVDAPAPDVHASVDKGCGRERNAEALKSSEQEGAASDGPTAAGAGAAACLAVTLPDGMQAAADGLQAKGAAACRTAASGGPTAAGAGATCHAAAVRSEQCTHGTGAFKQVLSGNKEEHKGLGQQTDGSASQQ